MGKLIKLSCRSVAQCKKLSHIQKNLQLMVQKVQPIFEKHYVEILSTKKFFKDFLNEVVSFQYSILKE